MHHPWDPDKRVQAREITQSQLIERDRSTLISPSYEPHRLTLSSTKDYTKDAGELARPTFFDWLDADEREGPFFAVINLMEAHTPRVPTLESRRALFRKPQIRAQLNLDQSYGLLMSYTVGRHEYSPLDPRGHRPDLRRQPARPRPHHHRPAPRAAQPPAH